MKAGLVVVLALLGVAMATAAHAQQPPVAQDASFGVISPPDRFIVDIASLVTDPDTPDSDLTCTFDLFSNAGTQVNESATQLTLAGSGASRPDQGSFTFAIDADADCVASFALSNTNNPNFDDGRGLRADYDASDGDTTVEGTITYTFVRGNRDMSETLLNPTEISVDPATLRGTPDLTYTLRLQDSGITVRAENVGLSATPTNAQRPANGNTYTITDPSMPAVFTITDIDDLPNPFRVAYSATDGSNSVSGTFTYTIQRSPTVQASTESRIPGDFLSLNLAPLVIDTDASATLSYSLVLQNPAGTDITDISAIGLGAPTGATANGNGGYDVDSAANGVVNFPILDSSRLPSSLIIEYTATYDPAVPARSATSTITYTFIERPTARDAETSSAITSDLSIDLASITDYAGTGSLTYSFMLQNPAGTERTAAQLGLGDPTGATATGNGGYDVSATDGMVTFPITDRSILPDAITISYTVTDDADDVNRAATGTITHTFPPPTARNGATSGAASDGLSIDLASLVTYPDTAGLTYTFTLQSSGMAVTDPATIGLGTPTGATAGANGEYAVADSADGVVSFPEGTSATPPGMLFITYTATDAPGNAGRTATGTIIHTFMLPPVARDGAVQYVVRAVVPPTTPPTAHPLTIDLASLVDDPDTDAADLSYMLRFCTSNNFAVRAGSVGGLGEPTGASHSASGSVYTVADSADGVVMVPIPNPASPPGTFSIVYTVSDGTSTVGVTTCNPNTNPIRISYTNAGRIAANDATIDLQNPAEIMIDMASLSEDANTPDSGIVYSFELQSPAGTPVSAQDIGLRAPSSLARDETTYSLPLSAAGMVTLPITDATLVPNPLTVAYSIDGGQDPATVPSPSESGSVSEVVSDTAQGTITYNIAYQLTATDAAITLADPDTITVDLASVTSVVPGSDTAYSFTFRDSGGVSRTASELGLGNPVGASGPTSGNRYVVNGDAAGVATFAVVYQSLVPDVFSVVYEADDDPSVDGTEATGTIAYSVSFEPLQSLDTTDGGWRIFIEPPFHTDRTGSVQNFASGTELIATIRDANGNPVPLAEAGIEWHVVPFVQSFFESATRPAPELSYTFNIIGARGLATFQSTDERARTITGTYDTTVGGTTTTAPITIILGTHKPLAHSLAPLTVAASSDGDSSTRESFVIDFKDGLMAGALGIDDFDVTFSFGSSPGIDTRNIQGAEPLLDDGGRQVTNDRNQRVYIVTAPDGVVTLASTSESYRAAFGTYSATYSGTNSLVLADGTPTVTNSLTLHYIDRDGSPPAIRPPPLFLEVHNHKNALSPGDSVIAIDFDRSPVTASRTITADLGPGAQLLALQGATPGTVTGKSLLITDQTPSPAKVTLRWPSSTQSFVSTTVPAGDVNANANTNTGQQTRPATAGPSGSFGVSTAVFTIDGRGADTITGPITVRSTNCDEDGRFTGINPENKDITCIDVDFPGLGGGEARFLAVIDDEDSINAGVRISRGSIGPGPADFGSVNFDGGGGGGGGRGGGSGGGGSALTTVNLVMYDVCSDTAKFRIVGTTVRPSMQGSIIHGENTYLGTDVTNRVDISDYITFHSGGIRAFVFDVEIPGTVGAFIAQVEDDTGVKSPFPVTVTNECHTFKKLFPIVGGTVLDPQKPFFELGEPRPSSDPGAHLLKTTIQYDSFDYTIRHSANIVIAGATINEADKSLTIKFQSPVTGTAQLDVSEIVQGDYTITARDQIIPFERNVDVLTMELDGVDEMVIVGTSIIPEFGLIALLILSIGFGSIVLCKRPRLSFQY